MKTLEFALQQIAQGCRNGILRKPILNIKRHTGDAKISSLMRDYPELGLWTSTSLVVGNMIGPK